mmetsp:Transcript_93377/g.171355  ORF Transcript_93377/g.171355 Transcript_93377/m.171355 type:complete len:388 (+) Transcript_93377:74-1237(+)
MMKAVARWLPFSAPLTWAGGLLLMGAAWTLLRIHIATVDDLSSTVTACRQNHISQGAPRDGHTYFFSIGDFGVAGCQSAHSRGELEKTGGAGHKGCSARRQGRVAKVMERIASGLEPRFVLSLGDNFYVRGVVDLEDPQFNESFEDVYSHNSLAAVPWQITLGDHDQRGNVSALLLHTARSSRWRFPKPYYSFALDDSPIEFFILDSVGLEGGTGNSSELGNRRFAAELSEEFAGVRAGTAQWDWLESALLEVGNSALRIVVGHRPVVSSVDRDRRDVELKVAERLRELLRRASENGPVLYLSGHDHAMQYLEEPDKRVQYAGSGVGGFDLHPLLKTPKAPSELRWDYNESNGFLVHEVAKDMMTLHFVDVQGAVLHSVDIPFDIQT